LSQCTAELAAHAAGQRTDVPDSGKVMLALGGGHSCDCQELLERVNLLHVLFEFLAGQNPNLKDNPPTEADGLIIQLPEELEKTLEKRDGCDWPLEGDLTLLRGLYFHGFGNWSKIAQEMAQIVEMPEVVKKGKTDKIRHRANKLLAILFKCCAADKVSVSSDRSLSDEVDMTPSSGVVGSRIVLSSSITQPHNSNSTYYGDREEIEEGEVQDFVQSESDP